MSTKWLIVAIATSLVLAAAIFAAAHPYYLDLYLGHAPRVPVPETGHVYERFEHGAIVYLSMKEIFVLYGLIAAGVLAAAALGVSLRALWRPRLSGWSKD